MHSTETIMDGVVQSLRAAPRLTLNRVAAQMQIDRHTLQDRLRSAGMDFVALRSQFTLAAFHELRNLQPPLSQKYIAIELGFPSPSALSHYLRRHSHQSHPPRPESDSASIAADQAPLPEQAAT